MSEGEEKTEDPSTRKLRRSREEGQVATRQNIVSAVIGAAFFAYLLAQGSSLVQGFKLLIVQAINSASAPAPEALMQLMPLLLWQGWSVVLTMAGIALAAVIAIHVVVTGWVFSFKPIVPDLKKINPISGLKNVFGERGWIEFAKALGVVIVLGSALVIVALNAAPWMVSIPSCGFACLGPSLDAVARPLIVTAILVGLVAGGLDIPLQNYLFRKQQRMTKTEVKREIKEDMGSPEMIMERRRLQREAATDPKKFGVRFASVVMSTPQGAVAIRYVKGETHVPLVVARARDAERTSALLTQAQSLGIPIVEAVEAKRLADTLAVGAYIPEQHFQPVIAALRKVKAL